MNAGCLMRAGGPAGLLKFMCLRALMFLGGRACLVAEYHEESQPNGVELRVARWSESVESATTIFLMIRLIEYLILVNRSIRPILQELFYEIGSIINGRNDNKQLLRE